ncbi:MbtH family NRPS accessory protein [Kocuria rhizosphaericola]|uniref:MbtH family NRPS accessory protein n=1 Tax=Kocuria rhizosphaericola TaxID=3376284 RepID=UPI0037BD9731
MMSIPDLFDDPSTESRVVIDGHGRACLWPACCPVPLGWTTALCPAPYDEAVAFLNGHHDRSSPAR